MNRYIVIDFKNLEILNLNKVFIDFEENKEQTSSISCRNLEDLFNELDTIIESEKDTREIRVCSECKKDMHEGFVIDNGLEYYCSEVCLHKHYTEEEYEEMYDNGNGDSYYTSWEV